MSNLEVGKAKKGSKMLIQELINEKPNKINDILIKNYGFIDIKWISPLKLDNYREYHLNDKIYNQHVYEILNLDNPYREYPGRGPEYDALGIAKTKDNKTITIFVEAKANLEELNSRCSSKDFFNRKKIEYEIGNVFNNLGSIDDESSEYNTYYQLLNRYTYLNHYPNSILVYIYFYNDKSFKSVSKIDFLKKMVDEINEKINSKLINKNLENRVIRIGFDYNEIIDR